MKPKLFGSSNSNSSKRALSILQDAGVSHTFVEVDGANSDMMEAVSSISGSTELPQLLVGGDVYVGVRTISRYIES